MGSIKFGPRDSVAGKIVDYCNVHFRTSKTDSIERYYYELDQKHIKVHASPVDSLKIGDPGIFDYHCWVIKPDDKVFACFFIQSIWSVVNIRDFQIVC